MLNEAQLRKYRVEWARCRAALRQYGRSPSEAEDERMAIHREATGEEKSSRDLTNAEFDRVLALFWTWSQPADLNAQLRQENQTGIRCRWICRHLLELFAEIDPDNHIPDDRKDAYIDGTFGKLNPKCLQDPDWAGFQEWHKVMSAFTFRYDQLVRKALGKARKVDHDHQRNFTARRVEYHPSLHDEHMHRIRKQRRFLVQRRERQQELVAAGHTLDEGDPF